MRRLLVLLAAGAVCALALTALSGATTPKMTVWTAALTSGKEVPAQVVRTEHAHGLFKARATETTLRWKLTYEKLSGPAMAAHIHMGGMDKAGDVVVPLCGATPVCKSGLEGTITLTPALKTAFRKHLLYVNVHTAKNPAGEIRGQLARG